MRGLALFIAIALLLSGCWSRRELTEVSFAGIMGIDWQDDRYRVTVVINAPRRQSGEGGGAPTRKVWTVSEEGSSLDAALSKMDQALDRSLTLHHVRAIVIGEAMARRGIGKAIDFLLRSVEIRPTAWISVTNGEAFDLLGARPRQDELSEGPLGYQDAAQRRSSITLARRLTEVANILQEEGVELTLPAFFRGDLPGPGAGEDPYESSLSVLKHGELEVKYGGSGVFLGDKLVGWLAADETRGFLWVTDRAVHGAIVCQCPTPKPDQQVVFRIRSAAGKVSTRIENGQVKGLLYAKVVADVDEMSCDEPMLTNGDVSKLERVASARVVKSISLVTATSKRYRSDFLGFGQVLFRQNPAAFTSRQQRWEEILQEMPVTVKVDVQIPRLGQLNKRYRWTTEH